MSRKLCSLFVAAAALTMGLGMSTADAAVVRARAGAGVAINPGLGPNVAYAYRGATAARLTPYRPLVGPQVHHAGKGVVVRGY